MLKAPFPYFGGKSKIAASVWAAVGQPGHYIEPFFGSGAVLLARPDWRPDMTETVNDKDGFVCNVWRSIQFSPDETARWCDWPVNHADLMARRAELIRNEARLLENLIADPVWHDPVIAGYWIWAASCWIGSGLTSPGAIPDIGNTGVHGKRPHISDTGVGVHRQITDISGWLNELSVRLRRVRVVCGDWARVCGGDWQDKKWPTVGMFFDPPYSAEANRDNNIYRHESLTVAHDVREWCIERGRRDNYRIVVTGYAGEHEELLQHGWTFERWETRGGYGNQDGGENENSKKEVIWYSPYCKRMKTLFD